jgi:glycosyltransferase involved in cell wall biosynthesis
MGAFAAALSSEELVLFSRIGVREDVIPRDGHAFGPFARTYARPSGNAGIRVLPALPAMIRSFPKELSALVAEQHRQRPWDMVIIEHCYAYVALPPLPGAQIVLNEHNIESTYWRRRLSWRPAELPHNLHQYAIWRRYETTAWRRVDAVTVVSEQDAVEVRKVRPDSGMVFPNGVDIDKHRFILPSRRVGARVLFLGTMDYEPNIQAAIMLAKQVMPELRALVPDATLTIAGRDPFPVVRGLGNSFVHVTGAIDDLRDLFDSHATFAMPIELGAGSSLKALEALAAGLPLVASPFAVRGHPLVGGVHYVDARTPREIAAALAEVLNHRQKFDAMAHEGRAVAESLSWRGIGSRFAEWVRATRVKRSGLERAPVQAPLAGALF